jgi:hypothetical protein
MKNGLFRSEQRTVSKTLKQPLDRKIPIQVRCEPGLSREFAFLGREAGVFRGCAGRGERRGRQRRAGRGNIGPTGGKYLCRAIFQYRAAGDVGSLTDSGGFEFGSGSGKTERGPLIVPGERQT